VEGIFLAEVSRAYRTFSFHWEKIFQDLTDAGSPLKAESKMAENRLKGSYIT
jgi:hypothetical protein